MEITKISPDTIIGKGRSGQVVRATDKFGNELAVKVFSGVDDLTNFVNYFITGATNPYGWNEDAVLCAHYRREILSVLVNFWFGSHLKIAKSYGIGWSKAEKSYKISAEFIDGRPASLHHPFSSKSEWELIDLSEQIMPRLQKKLAQSGFDGLVWQAGKGNPIALNNFLLDGNGNWVWIDAESGVPALFPLNPISLFLFYLPKSIKFRRALFDDVDTKQIRSYLKQNQNQLKNKFGLESLNQLTNHVEKLEFHQNKWKSVKRINKSIIYKYKKEELTHEQAEWYSKHQSIWFLHEFANFAKRAVVKIGYKLPIKIIRRIVSIKYWSLLKNSISFVFNGAFRKVSVEKLIKSRISDWEEREQLSLKQANFLRKQAEYESASPYLADFIILIGLKPIMNFVELVVLPTMYAAAFINEATLAIGVALGGIIYRTIYTIGKMIYEQFALNSEERHPRWIALFIGLIPTFGNAAYPAQMVYNAGLKSKELSEFLMYDIFARIGAKIPIWGGKDTRTEHFFNHIPDIIIRKRRSIQQKRLRYYTTRIRKKAS